MPNCRGGAVKTKLSIAKIIIVLFGFLFIIVFSTDEGYGASYYVSTIGLDTNQGTESGPWRTIQHAADRAEPGDTVFIRQGTYAESVVTSKSGNPGNYITFRRYGTETVIIDAQGGVGDNCIRVSGQDYLKFVGLDLRGASAAAFSIGDDSDHIIIDQLNCHSSRFGIVLAGISNPVRFITIRNSTIHHNSKYGIFLNRKVYDSEIGPANHIYSNAGEPFSFGIEVSTDFPGDPSNGARRITIFENEVDNNAVQGIRTWNAFGVLIRDNNFHHNGASGIQIEDGSRDIIIQGNSCVQNAQAYSYESGIWIDDSENCSVIDNFVGGNEIGILVTGSNRVIVRQNVVVDNNRAFSNLTNTSGLIVDDNSSDIAVVHNTFSNNCAVSSSKASLVIYSISSVANSAVIKNNIIFNTASPQDIYFDVDNFSSDHNLIYNVRNIVVHWMGMPISFSAYRGISGKDALSFIQLDPKFASIAVGDYSLLFNSPAIDKGGFLTNANGSGTGRDIIVDDIRYFSDGNEMIDGDLVQIGNNSPVAIIELNYSLRSIIVDSDISWNDNDPISFAYKGAFPDIGAIESAGTFASGGSGGGGGCFICWEKLI